MNEYGSRETPFPSIDHKEKILYKGLTVHSEYITMRDGVEIAVSYCLPKGMDSGTRIPAALFQTRYWRTRRIRAPLGWFVNEVFGNRPVPQVLTSRGYATIHVDVRGTGASTGHRPEGPFSKAEIEDGREIIDWIVRQPWSNGEVIPLGVSYVGSTSEFCAALGHSATRACMPLHSFWDAYTDVVFPGGVYDQRFMQMWSFFGRSLDLNSSHAFKEVRPLYYYLLRSVTPVNSDPDEIKLRAVVEEHAQNQYVDDLTQDYDYSDDTTPEGLDLASRSLYPYANSLGRTGIPIYTICSWYDSGYGEAVINKFLNLENPMIAILGDWNHGAAEPVKIGRRRPKRINRDLKDIKHHWHHHADFFDTCLRGDGIQGKTLFYYTVGQEEWKRT
ncbi:MAG: CocE/NonD family hydrolase, partial [Candidatus Thorarchaeota archaeon]